MKKSLLILGLTLVASIYAVSYAHPQESKGKQGQHASFEEFLAQRTHFFIQEMKLNEADSARFVVVYQDLMKDKGNLMRKYSINRDIWHKIRNGETLADSVYVQMVENEARMQVEDAQLELSYIERLSKVLTPRQVFDYRQAEKKFRSNFMRRDRNQANKTKKK